MRVVEHPILDELDTAKTVTIYFDGMPLVQSDGEKEGEARDLLRDRKMYRLYDDRGRRAEHKDLRHQSPRGNEGPYAGRARIIHSGRIRSGGGTES